MSTLGFIEYEKASPEVRAVYDDIMATRKIDKVTHFWKAPAHDPVRLKRVWEDTKSIMAAGALDPLVKELIYVAVNKGKTPTPVKFQDINANYAGFQVSNIESAYARAKAHGAMTVLLKSALAQSNGVQARAADVLKISYRSFRHLMKKYDL